MSKKISQLTTNVSPLESDLTIAVNSGETKKLTLGAALVVPHPNNLVYENLTFTLAETGAVTAPDRDTDNGAFLFAQTGTETVVGNTFMPHSWAEGTDILPHIHWIQSASGTVVWQLEYKWYNKGELVPASFTTITASTVEYSWTSGDLHQITEFPAIAGSGKNIESIVILKVSRLGDDGADDYAADAPMISFDFRVQKDALGTRQIGTK